MKNLYKIEDELYIISDKEKSSYCIKECPMAGLTIDRCDCPIQGGCSNKVGTVILTTNDLLIKDGVQAIDDEFLEWFVKNPSCEYVEVNEVEICTYCGQQDCDNLRCRGHEDKTEYLISIPSNITKEIITYCNGYEISRKKIPKEEPKQDLEKEMFELEEQLDIPSHLRWHNSKPKQETLEEAAERYVRNEPDTTLKLISKYSFKDGVKWQKERSYSEEEVLELLNNCRGENPINISKWFEQFKKK